MVKNIMLMESGEVLSMADECEKYGINYQNPNNLFCPVFCINKNDFVYPGAFYLYSDLKKFPELEVKLDEYNSCIVDFASSIRNAIRINGTIKMMKYSHKLNKLASQISKIEKQGHIKCFSIKEKDDYIANYQKSKMEELNLAKIKKSEVDFVK